MSDPRLSVPLTKKSTGMPTPVIHGLHRIGCQTIGDLVSRTERDILSGKGCGKTTVKRVQQFLARLGLHLKEEVDVESLVGLTLNLSNGMWTIGGHARMSAQEAVKALRSAADEIATIEAMTPGTIVTRAAAFAAAIESILSEKIEVHPEAREMALKWCAWMREEFERWKAVRK